MSDLFTQSLAYHQQGNLPGKLTIQPTKPLKNQLDLSLAYSPGVAGLVKAIAQNPKAAYDYTIKGNLVAVISNGTAILGLGNKGALASKPVMEGKAVLFKKFGQVEAIDIEVNTEDPDDFIRTVELISPTFGGVNLEDIKAPECFYIEEELIKRLDIPVFHDDQHGTAIVAGAGLLNALEIVNKKIDQVRIVLNGAGSAGIAMCRLFTALGVKEENLILCDSKGVIYRGRKEGMNKYKQEFAVDLDNIEECHTEPGRSMTDEKKIPLSEAIKGADVFMGVSVAGAVNADMVRSMADKPVVFALANPEPEITYEETKKVRPDAIMATGRSDYPNQINNVLGFPYIFRGVFDAKAKSITEPMKIAATKAIAGLARQPVPAEVLQAYDLDYLELGLDYIIPKPFDPRLIETVAPAVVRAA